MAISFVNRTNADFLSAQASLTVTIAGTAAGSILVVAGEFDAVATTVTMSDSSSDSPTSVIAVFDRGDGVNVFCAAFFSVTTGVTSVTATYSGGTPTFGDLFVWEIAGLTNAVTDKTNHATGSSASPDSGSTGTLSTAAEAAIAFVTSAGSATGIGSGWSNYNQNNNTGSGGEERVTAATTAFDGTFTATNSNWACIVATFMSGAAAQPSGSNDYYSVKAAQQGVINGAQPHLLAYESPAPRTFVRPSGESAFYDVDPYPKLRFCDQHDAYATRFVQQNPPPGSGGFSWYYDRSVYPKLRFRDQHETYPARGNVPSPVTPVGWTTPYDARLWAGWRHPRPELLTYDGQATNSFAFTAVPQGASAFFDFDKYPALQFRHQHEGYPARGNVPTATTPQGWTAFYDMEVVPRTKAALADHEAAEFTFFPPRPLWTDYYDAEVIRGRARDYSEAPAPATQVATAFIWTDYYDVARARSVRQPPPAVDTQRPTVVFVDFGAYYDRARLRPNLTQQHDPYPALGLVPTAATPQGFTAPFDLARVLGFPVRLQQHDAYQHFIPPVAVNLGPLGWSMYWDRGKRPPSADRMPFLFEQLYQTPTAATPQGWTFELGVARVRPFPAHLQQHDALQRLSFPPPFIALPGDWYGVSVMRPRARDYQVVDRPMFFPPPSPFDWVDVRVVRPRAFPYSVIDQQPTAVVPPSAYVLFPDLFKRPRAVPYLTWPEQRVAVLNTPAGTGGPTYFYDRRLFVAHRPVAEVVPFDGRGLPFVVVNIIVHRPGKGGLLTPVLLAATKGQPTLAGIQATPTLGGEVED